MNIKKLQLLYTICLLFVVIKYTKCSESKRKHVVFIVADDLGWNDVSFHGSNQFVTPNIDALAYSGVIFKNYYVLPLCSPSRSALMSGLHPIKTGMYHYVLLAAQPTGLPLDIKILPQYMKDYGYKTHAVGKWHLGFCKESYTPTKRGFDTHFGYWTGHEAYYDHRAEEPPMIGNDFRRGMDNISYEYQGQYATDLFTDEAVNVINSHNTTEPLFLYLAHLAVHSANTKEPLQAPKEIIDKFSYIEDENRRIFAAMVWKLDESVGKVVQALFQKNMLEDTIIIFSTDNGGPAAGYNQNVASNWPLRGVKDTLWEGGVRGASFIWSADLPHSTTNSALMHIQDWLPTILGAIGEQPAELLDLDGRNMWPVLKGEKEYEYDEIILQRDDLRRIAALRKDNWKVIKGIVYKGKYDKCFGPTGRDKKYAYNITAVSESPVATALRTKFPFPKEDQILSIRKNVTLKCDNCDINNNSCLPCDLKKGPCLFDVSNDACEQNDLSQKYPDILKDLLSRVDTYKPVRPRFPLLELKANPIFWNNTWTNWLDYEGSESSRGPQIAFNMLEKRMMLQD